ncbi:MAG: Bug family tripartite tricarboxylate transporter substrate binding protein [Rhodoglobus sp.]
MRFTPFVAAAAVSVMALTGCSATATDSTDSGTGAESLAISDVQVVVPADPGGGWDQTGRALAQTLTGEGLVSSAPVTNVPGAGGTVGLASLANETNPHTLMMMGLVMVGAIETNASANRIEDTTPIARLTEEALVVVVPAESKYTTLKGLVDDIVENGQAVTITGGSAGGADHILAGLLLGAAGEEKADITAKLNYTPNSGGGEAVTLILGNNVSAGISGVGEFVEHINAGTMRALAVSSEAPVEQLPDVPTIQDEGFDVTLTNWRGVVAPGSISDADRTALIELVTEMHGTAAWTEQLAAKGWTDAFLPGDEFTSYLDTNITDVKKTLTNIGLVG